MVNFIWNLIIGDQSFEFSKKTIQKLNLKLLIFLRAVVAHGLV